MENIRELRSLSLMNQQRDALRVRLENNSLSMNEYRDQLADLEDRWYDAVHRAYAEASDFIIRDENNAPFVDIDGVMVYDEPEFLVQLLIQHNIIQDQFSQFMS